MCKMGYGECEGAQEAEECTKRVEETFSSQQKVLRKKALPVNVLPICCQLSSGPSGPIDKNCQLNSLLEDYHQIAGWFTWT